MVIQNIKQQEKKLHQYIYSNLKDVVTKYSSNILHVFHICVCMCIYCMYKM